MRLSWLVGEHDFQGLLVAGHVAIVRFSVALLGHVFRIRRVGSHVLCRCRRREGRTHNRSFSVLLERDKQ